MLANFTFTRYNVNKINCSVKFYYSSQSNTTLKGLSKGEFHLKDTICDFGCYSEIPQIFQVLQFPPHSSLYASILAFLANLCTLTSFVVACFCAVLVYQIRQPQVTIGVANAVYSQRTIRCFNPYVFPIIPRVVINARLHLLYLVKMFISGQLRVKNQS